MYISVAVLLFGISAGIFIDKSGVFTVTGADVVYPAVVVFALLNLFSLARFSGLSKQREILLSDRIQAAENAFMNAQMKPHFIYNALNTIADRCTKDPEDAERLILLLSKYMRQTLSYDSLSGMTPLKKELDIVKAYAEIECRRFDNINVYYILPDELPEITLPPLTIQPLVENAIKHGLRKKHGGGYVVITVKKKKDRSYVISVEDNGVGINDEARDAMLNIPSGSDSIGLYNINQRLMSFFGTGLTVEKPEDGGTRVYFEIPEYNR
nr:histidine kinase [Clostridia bacterium]